MEFPVQASVVGDEGQMVYTDVYVLNGERGPQSQRIFGTWYLFRGVWTTGLSSSQAWKW